MSRDSTSPPPQQPTGYGLLSKVVKFVSNPTKDWKELDAIEEPQAGGVSEEALNAQQLRERMERKRRNDFIRKAEFAHLRKIIQARRKQRQPELPQGVVIRTGVAGRSSGAGESASSSSPPLQNPSGTLKKINEIEAQLSQQWWHAGQQGASTAAHAPVDAAAQEHATQTASALDSGFFLGGSSLFFADAVAEAFAAARRRMETQQAQQSDDEMVARLRRMDEVRAFFGLQEEFVHQPDLEEAAILFCSNRVAEAEKLLVEVIRKNANAPAQQQIELWLALLDLYRAVGAQDRFDAVAIDFAQRFDRSPPVWVSLPQLLGESQEKEQNRRPFSWTSAPELTAQSVQTADALRQRAGAPFHLNWVRLKHIHADALEPMLQFIEALTVQEGSVEFVAGQQLLELLQQQTVANDASVDRRWWLLRLAVLRLMNRAEDFELVALDYTVTYEESPPMWQPPVAHYRADDGGAAARTVQEQLPGAPAYSMGSGALHGRISNDATQLLEDAVAQLPQSSAITIDCSRLIVIDFAAAGSVLNWAAQQQSNGRVVAFSNLHRLIAVFFNVIGIQEHARILPRKD
ncbi:hypothetical protein AAV94_08980 [Lampropedia cohaerens]|uniref:MlaB-like STAS domain-containing protein n=1 Tax=Lampropedia cohaerens TaxID=1610491 RepID=A0A0U1PZ04_9BURK|nr:STAS domain-containing protein [Lampropedia cohaerens]KKW67752.1 hypothetical protein AAV94_08980 [Lampropedia cohaerens]